jgi:hypothetical protein
MYIEFLSAGPQTTKIVKSRSSAGSFCVYIDSETEHENAEEHISGRRKSGLYYLLHSSFLFDLFFDPEFGGDMFLRNVS